MLRLTGLKAVLAITAVSGTLGLATPVLAQNSTSSDRGLTGPNPSSTGAGERGTKVGRSTQPGQPDQSAVADPNKTGVGERGTKAGPSSSETATPGTHHDRD
jgi:hypothetical protein